MRVKTKLNKEDLQRIAESLSLKLYNYLYNYKEGGSYKSFTLKPTSKRFQRLGMRGQRINAICLHGYTSFMAHVLMEDKEAVFKSTFGEVNTKNIRRMYENLIELNIGSVIRPVYYGYACICGVADVGMTVETLKRLEEREEVLV